MIGLSRNALRYEARPDKDEVIRNRLKELAEQRRRSGCQLFHAIEKREGLVVNHKRTERIYKEERLSLTIRRRKKRASCARVEIPRAGKRNELWGLDFLHDSMGNGRKLRILPIIDTYTKKCHWIEVDRSIGGKRVTSVLSEVATVHGLPENIVVDNGPEFISNAWMNGHIPGSKATFYQTRQAGRQCVHGELQCKAQGRVSESQLVQKH